MPDETAQTANTVQSNDSAPANVPSEAPQAPANEVTPPPVKDDNLTPVQPEGQIPEPPQTAPESTEATPGKQTGEISPAPELNREQNPAPETETAQIPPSEPNIPETEPKPQPTKSESMFSSAPTPAEPVSPQPGLARQLIAKAREAIQTRKRKKIDHVMDLFAKRTNITNNQVADFLHVSDATATRYLQILENENKIRQVGKTGKGVKYEKI